MRGKGNIYLLNEEVYKLVIFYAGFACGLLVALGIMARDAKRDEQSKAREQAERRAALEHLTAIRDGLTRKLFNRP